MTRFRLYSSLAVFVCGLLLGPPGALGQVAGKWTPWIELGGKLSNELDNGEAELFVPLIGDTQSLLFVDLEGRIFEDSIYDGNFALGYREMTATGFNAGIWLGYAPFESASGKSFDGIAGGLELLSHAFDLRLNGYLPFDDKELLSQTTVAENVTTSMASLELGSDQFPTTGFTLTDLFFVTRTTGTRTRTSVHEYAMKGIDGEAGALVPFTPENFELRAYVGGYYFDFDAVEEVAGFKSRLELRVLDIIPDAPGSRLTFDAEYGYDDVRESRWSGGARLRIPLGGPSTTQTQMARLNNQERRMLDSIQREAPITQTNTTISTTDLSGETREQVEDALTDVSFDRVALVANTTDSGDVQSAIDATGANTLLIVNGGSTIDGQLTLQDNQTLMGGGGTIQVRGQTSGVETGFNAPGIRPTLSFTGEDTVVTVNNNGHVADLDIVGGGGNGTPVVFNTGIGTGASLFIPVSNVVVEDVNISNMGFFGMGLGGLTSDVLVFGSTIEDVNSAGIDLSGGIQRDITIRDNEIRNIGGSGIVLRDGTRNVTIQENEISNAGFDGIVAFSDNVNLTIDQNTISDVGNGVRLAAGFAPNTGLTLTNNIFSGTIGTAAFEFGGVFGVNSNEIVDGSNNTTVGGGVADACIGDGSFTGDLTVDGVTFNDAANNC